MGHAVLAQYPTNRECFRTALMFAALGVLLFSPVLLSWYSSDDFLHIATLYEGGIPFIPARGTGGFLRPLTGLSYWVDFHFLGALPLPAHLVGVLLHIANSLLVARFAIEVPGGTTPDLRFRSFASGLIFLVLGCHAEPVSWISCRGDLLVTFWGLLMLIFYCQALRTKRRAFWFASLFCFSFALLSKESSFALPVIAALCLVFAGRTAEKNGTRANSVVWGAGAHLLLLGVYFVYRKWMLGGFIGGYGSHGHLRINANLIAQSMGHFLWRAFLPPLPGSVVNALPELQGGLALLFLATLTMGIAFLAGWHRGTGPLLFCSLAFFAALLPVFNVRIYLESVEGERYLYLASVFLALALGYSIARVRRSSTRRFALAAVVLFQASVLLCGVRCWSGAAAIARTIVSGIQTQYDGGKVLLLNKPDAYGGALVFRTGLPEALRYLGPQPVKELQIESIYTCSLKEAHHTFNFGLAPGGPAGAYVLAATDGTSKLVEEDREDRVETLDATKQQVTFRFRAPLPEAHLFYYDFDGVKRAESFNVDENTPLLP